MTWALIAVGAVIGFGLIVAVVCWDGRRDDRALTAEEQATIDHLKVLHHELPVTPWPGLPAPLALDVPGRECPDEALTAAGGSQHHATAHATIRGESGRDLAGDLAAPQYKPRHGPFEGVVLPPGAPAPSVWPTGPELAAEMAEAQGITHTGAMCAIEAKRGA